MSVLPETTAAGLLWLAGLCGLAAIACESWPGGRRRAFYLLKPLTTGVILAAAALAADPDPAYRGWVCAGLLLSAAGDVALMWEDDDRAFLVGLGSFLVAHLLFVVAFLQHGLAMPGAWALLPALLGLAFLTWLLPRTGALWLPVTVYGVTLVAMSLAALARWTDQPQSPALVAVWGALVFLVSDAALAARRFAGPYPAAQALILSTYWISIGLIAASVVGSAALART